jgi:hypothetical protein
MTEDNKKPAVEDRVHKIAASTGDKPAKPQIEPVAGDDGNLGDRIKSGLEATGRFVARQAKPHWLLVAASLLATALIGSNWLPTLYITGTDINRFHITPTTMFDPPDQKMAAANWSSIMATRLAEQNHRPGERVLVFRQSEFGYFTDVPFLFFLDAPMVPIFLAEDRFELARLLRESGIRQMIVPDYPLAQIENSAFQSLFGDPALTQLQFSLDHYRIYTLRDETLGEGELLMREDFSENPELLADWHLNRLPMHPVRAFLSGQANLHRDAEEGFVELRRNRRFYARRHLWDSLQRGQTRMSRSAFISLDSDFDASSGTFALSADVEGDGYMEAVLVATTRDNREELIFEQPLWRGVLFEGERRTINAQFIDVNFVRPVAVEDSKNRLYRLAFRLRDGGYLRLYEWDVRRWDEQSPAEEQIAGYADPLREGWSFRDEIMRRHVLDFQAANDDPNPADGIKPVRISRFDSRAVGVTSPAFAAPADLLNIDALESSDAISRTAPPVISMRTQIAGRGLVDIGVEIACFNGETIWLPVTQIAVESEPREDILRFQSPCLPLEARATFDVQLNQTYVAPDMRLGTVEILDVDFDLITLDGDTPIQRAFSNLSRVYGDTSAMGIGNTPESQIRSPLENYDISSTRPRQPSSRN